MPECRRLPRPEEMAADVGRAGTPGNRDRRSKRLGQFGRERQESGHLELLPEINNRVIPHGIN